MATAEVIVPSDPPLSEETIPVDASDNQQNDDQSKDNPTKDNSSKDDDQSDGPRSVPVIRNQTPHRLLIFNAQKQLLVLAPLEQRQVDLKRWPTGGLEDLGLVRRHDRAKVDLSDWVSRFGIGVIVVGFFGYGFLVNWANSRPAHAWQIWTGAGAFVVATLVIGLLLVFRRTSAISRMLAQAVTLLLVMAISVLVPIGVVDRFADENLSSLHGVDVFVRVLQISIISIASMLPGLLFFFFDRQKLSTLRSRFEHQIFRLDPDVTTLSDVYARYGDQLEETYGSADSRQGDRLARQRRWPILLATLVLTVGWIIALAPVGVLPPNLSADAIPSVLAPRTHPVVFGFLGSYFFALNLIWRRYTRGDLRPKAYSAITVRVLVVLAVTWVVAATTTSDSDSILVASFLIGVVPETAFVLWRQAVTKALTVKELEETQPLQDIEGVDLYDRARLQDEGISNVQALAHHELVDLLLETRIPAGRLVDWVDQAILYLHCSESSDNDQVGVRNRNRLQGVGIRTATDFENAMKKGESRDALLAYRDTEKQAFDKSTLVLLLASLRDDEWMSYVRHWRAEPKVKNIQVAISADGLVAELTPAVYAGLKV